ncbi:MFS transporter [Anaerobacillus alkaliphilus]|nr:MFS transporter [Anaerobacillus alkaliphilus]
MFLLIWAGQFVSVIGTSLTSFALGFWVLTETGSVTQFSMIILSLVLPTIIISPFAGVIIDRFSRKKLMILANSAAAFSTLIILALVLTNSLEIWHIYVTTAFAASFNTFLMPTYQSVISLLVPKKQLGRANGLIQIGESASIIIAPTVAGLLLHLHGLHAVIIIDLVAFIIAVTTLVFAKIPELETKQTSKLNTKQFFVEAKEGWHYIMSQPAFKWLLFFSAFINLLLGFVNVLLQPLIITLSSEQTLGMVLSITGFGMLLGGIIISAWGGPKNRINGVFISCAIGGMMITLIGFTTSIVFITMCFFMFLFLLPIVNSCSQAIWQNKVEPSIQGRVFTIRRMLGTSLYPLAIVMAGPLVDKVFNPLMEPGGIFANTIGQLIGVGEGRGIGLLFIVIGGLFMIVTTVVYLQPKVRQMESDIPDAIIEEKELLSEPV